MTVTRSSTEAHVAQDAPAGRPSGKPQVAISRFTGKKVHFIGIGGCGMSGLANMLLDCGAIVTGSEPKLGDACFKLAGRGARLCRNQIGELLTRDVDLVVRTAAVPDTNPEYLAARRLNLPVIKYAQLLGQIMDERVGVAVAGTHGKSTTSAMISYALVRAGEDPSFVIGGQVPQLGGSSQSGTGSGFIAEACEFDRSFHSLRPTVAVVTNIELDHLDCYRDLDEINESFATFCRLLPTHGRLITNGHDANCRKLQHGLHAGIDFVTLDGKSDASGTFNVVNRRLENGCWAADVLLEGRPLASLRLSMPGEHNLMNAAMALAVCVRLGANAEACARGLNEFTGVDRRMSVIGRPRGSLVVDDYGHHPTEIRVTLKALRDRYAPERLRCVFQPHQHSRTRCLIDEFATCFHDADEVIIPDIYRARDSDDDVAAIGARDLVNRIEQHHADVRHVAALDDIVRQLRSDLRPGDVIVTMGAGNVHEVAHHLVAEESAAAESETIRPQETRCA